MKKFLLPFFILLASCQPSGNILVPDKSASSLELPNFDTITDTTERKQAFFNFLLPLVQSANQQILFERGLVYKWIKNPNRLSAAEQQEIQNLIAKYRVKEQDKAEQQQRLLRRVNIIPPSLVLAQAANESAWGTSRFAKEGNNLFGQWCFSMGCGIIPGERNHRSKHEVRVFDSPFASVQSYMRNLNSHPKYQNLRDTRHDLLLSDASLSGLSLADGLLGYSERGEAYVHEIKSMIKHNHLYKLDATPLGIEND